MNYVQNLRSSVFNQSLDMQLDKMIVTQIKKIVLKLDLELFVKMPFKHFPPNRVHKIKCQKSVKQNTISSCWKPLKLIV